jgi:hypothetical protein
MLDRPVGVMGDARDPLKNTDWVKLGVYLSLPLNLGTDPPPRAFCKSTYAEEMREALERWAKHVKAITCS